MEFGYISGGRDRKKLKWIGSLLMLGSILSLILSNVFPGGRLVLQGFFALFLMAASFVFIRFLLVIYGCEVRREEDGYVLYAYQQQGTRRSTLLYTPVSEILDIRQITKEAPFDKKEVHRFYRCSTAPFSPSVAIYVEGNGGVGALILEYNEEFFAHLEALRSSLKAGTVHDPAEQEGEVQASE